MKKTYGHFVMERDGCYFCGNKQIAGYLPKSYIYFGTVPMCQACIDARRNEQLMRQEF